VTAAPLPRSVRVGSRGPVTALVYEPAGVARATLVLAHGAGADQRHRFMTAVAAGVAGHGVRVVTFNFLYTEQRRSAPDRAPVLEETWRHVAAFVAEEIAPAQRFVIGGKSMGGRIASHVAAAPLEEAWQSRLAGLVLLGYPLHPPGKPDRLRTAHLANLTVPILLVQGTRDAFGTRAEVEPVFAQLSATVDFEFIESGDHSFAVPKSSGRTERDVLAGVSMRVAGWVRARCTAVA